MNKENVYRHHGIILSHKENETIIFGKRLMTLEIDTLS